MLLALPTEGFAQEDLPTVWLESVTSSVDEGGTIHYTVRRSGNTSGTTYVVVRARPNFPDADGDGDTRDDRFDILTLGGLFLRDVRQTHGFASGATSISSYFETLDNTLVNLDVPVTVSIIADPSSYVLSTTQDTSVQSRVDNDSDAYTMGVRLPDSDETTATVTEGDKIELQFMRCVGASAVDAIATCEDVDERRPGAVEPTADLLRSAYVRTQGNYFSGSVLGEQVDDSDPSEMVFTSAIFVRGFSASHTISTVGDSTDEKDGTLVVRTFSGSTGANRYVSVTINDDDLTTISLAPVSASVTEGSDAVFRVTRSTTELFPETSVRVDLQYHTKKFTSETTPKVKNPLTLAAGQSSADLTIPTANDNLNDGDGMIRAVLVGLSSGYNVGNDSTWIRVVDDDVPQVTLSVNKTSIVEGETWEWSTERSAYFENNLGTVTGYEARYYQPDDLWPDFIDEVTLTDLSFSYAGYIPAGQSVEKTLITAEITNVLVGPQGGYRQRRILPFPEDDFEGIPESVNRTFKPRYTVTSSDWVRVDIYNSAPGVEIESSLDSVTEGNGIEFTLSRFGGAPNIIPQFAARIRVEVKQTGDFLPESELGVRTVTMAAGETSASFQVATTGDQLDEDNGEVTVTILPGAATGHTEDAYDVDTRYSELDDRYTHTSSVTVLDDDEPHVLTVVDASAGESAAGVEFVFDLAAPAIAASSVDYATSDGTATAGSDYTATSGTVEFAIGDETNTVVVPILSDDIVEGDETFALKLSNPSRLSVADDSIQGTIEDDDDPAIVLTPTSISVDEAGHDTYTVKLAREPATDVTVTPAPPTGATITVSHGSLTFTPSNWHEAQEVRVTAIEEGNADNETWIVPHSASGGAYADAPIVNLTVNVRDNDTPSTHILVAVEPRSVAENEATDGETITVTATLNTSLRSEATPVSLTVSGGTAGSGDFTAVEENFEITIPADTRSATGSFELTTIDDGVHEPSETVRVRGTTTVPELTVTGAEVRITDDDPLPTLTLALSESSIGEDGGAARVTASLSEVSGAITVVIVSVDPDSPATASDYTLSSYTRLIIAAGRTTSSGRVTVTAVDNDRDAADRTVRVKGAAENSTGVLGPSDVTLTILDDDTRGVTVSVEKLRVGEGDEESYTVVLDSEPTDNVTVTPSRSSGDADITVGAALTFTAEDWDTAQTVTVSAEEDADAIDDTAVIGHAVSGGDYGAVTAASVDVTADDDEEVSTGVALSVAPAEVSEGADATTVTVTASLDGVSRGSDTPVSVTVDSGTATSGTDFAAVTGFTITIPANSRSHTETFSLTPTQDTVDEPDETVAVKGTTTVTDFSVTGTEVQITDDDAAPTVTLSLSDASISEDSGVSTVTASLGHASSVATTVTVSVSPDAPAAAGDYSLSMNEVLTIAAGATASTGTVTITGVGNDIDGADKTVRVEGAASNTLGISGPEDVELTLEDNDTRGVTLSKSELAIAEGDDGTYTVVLDSEPTGPVTVTPARSSGDTDVTASGALTFTADDWNGAQTVTVSAGHDTDAAEDTAVIGHSVSGADYSGVTADSVDVRVDDDETASSGVTLTVSPESVSEAANATTVTVTASLDDGTRGESTAVAVTVGSGTAISGTDFAAVGGFTITIPSDTQSHTGTFSLSPVQDTVDEPDETVSVTGATSVPDFSVTGATVEITDDDSWPLLTLSLSDASIGEDGGSTTVTANLSHASSEPTRVTVSVEPEPPATGSDYTVSANTILTIAAGSTVSTGTVTVTDDAGFDEVLVSDALQTPRIAAPPEPRNLRATGGDGRAVLTWEPPLDDGGAPVAGYEYRYAAGDSVPEDAAWNSVGTDLSATLDGLANGETHSFEVRALNLVGAGPAARASAVPATVPEAPARLTAIAGDAQVALAWEAPASDGGAEIIDYEYRFAVGPNPPAGASWRSAGPDLGETVTGLANGETYAFEVRAVNGLGAGPAASGAAELAELNRFSDAMLDGWLARFGRAASFDTAELIRRRLEEGPQRSQLILGGQRIDGLLQGPEKRAGEPAGLAHPSWDPCRMCPGGVVDRTAVGARSLPGDPSLAANGPDRRPGRGSSTSTRLPSFKELLLRSSFHSSSARDDDSGEAKGAGPRTVWGGGGGSRFDARVDSLALEGEVSTGILGFDGQWGRLLAGLALSHSQGEGSYRNGGDASGLVRSELTGLYPYAHFQVGPTTSFWGTLGYGTGQLRLVPDEGASVNETDLSNAMLALGGRGVLSTRMGESSRFELALRSDALLTNTGADAFPGFDDDAEGSTSRVRLML